MVNLTVMSPTWQPRRLAFTVLIVAAVVFPAGCSKEEMKKVAATVQQQSQDLAVSATEYTSGVVEEVEKQLPHSGSISLRLDPPVEIDSANIQVLVVGGDRPNVMQLASYDTESGPSSYPSLLAHGPTSVTSAAELVNKTVQCDLYIQTKSGGPILITRPGESVTVSFGPFHEDTSLLKASIASTPMISTDDRPTSMNGGTVHAKVLGAK